MYFNAEHLPSQIGNIIVPNKGTVKIFPSERHSGTNEDLGTVLYSATPLLGY